MITEKQQGKKSYTNFAIPEDFTAKHQALKAQIGAKMGLVFEEHCSECSYPSCYATCSFYSPREDLHCRRFVAGFEAFENSKECKLVRFRKWGKIEAVGGEKPHGTNDAKVIIMEVANRLPIVPYFVKRNFAYNLNQQQKADAHLELAADAFVLEAISGDGETHAITVSIFNVGVAANGKMYLGQFAVTPEYGCLVINLDDIKKHVDLNQKFLIQIEPMNEAEGRAIVFGLCDFVAFKETAELKPKAIVAKPAATKPAKAAKLVVWDLDETLWHGILVEDGIEGVKVRPEAVKAIQTLDERGIVHSIASKNDQDLVEKALKHFGLDEYFLYPQIGWGPKSISIKNLAEQISLGIDSFVFVDDQPFERAEVGNAHPQMRILTHEDVGKLPEFDFFPTSVTEESKNRRAMYKADEVRNQALVSGGDDYEEFLRKANMSLIIDRLNDKNMARVHELSQRTNQLNYNGYKYPLDELLALKDDDSHVCVTLTCRDNFGEYGLIGFVVIDKAVGKIDQFFMSCRAQKKRVENAFYEWLRQKLQASGHDKIMVSYHETPKNKASRDMLDELGFKQQDKNSYIYDNGTKFASSEIVVLTDNSDWKVA